MLENFVGEGLAPPEKEFLFRNDIKNTQCEFCEGGSNKLRFYCFCKVCENYRLGATGGASKARTP